MYHTKLLSDPEEVQRLYRFLQRFPLDYPNYEGWLEKCVEELEHVCKGAFYSRDPQGRIVGSIVFQRHKQDRSVLEVKSVRVSEGRQGIGSLLMSLVATYARDNGYKIIQVDAHPENEVVLFLQKRGYVIEAHESLYTARKEVVLCKRM